MWAIGVGEPEDLDVVVGGTKADVERIVDAWVTRAPRDATVDRTKLGGYRLSARGCVLDVWAAPTTVAIAAERVQDTKRYRAIAKSAALSLDSLVLTSEGTVYDHGFFRTLQTGTLELNHTRVERRDQVVAKARRLCQTYGLTPDLELQGWLAEGWEAPKGNAPLLQLPLPFKAPGES